MLFTAMKKVTDGRNVMSPRGFKKQLFLSRKSFLLASNMSSFFYTYLRQFFHPSFYTRVKKIVVFSKPTRSEFKPLRG